MMVSNDTEQALVFHPDYAVNKRFFLYYYMSENWSGIYNASSCTTCLTSVSIDLLSLSSMHM